ncbi:DUF433 domain-containing protein [Microbacterium sp.]|uniref:DUF433 domain-containing protein n=1 Tax=Microbacterium sp. TaxID=51671 RepID=UPI0039E299DA
MSSVAFRTVGVPSFALSPAVTADLRVADLVPDAEIGNGLADDCARHGHIEDAVGIAFTRELLAARPLPPGEATLVCLRWRYLREMAALPGVYLEPRYSQAEAARIVGVPANSLRNWASGYTYLTASGQRESTGLIALAEPFRSLSVPFAGLAEAHVITSLKAAGLPMQRIRPAVMKLREEIGVQEALLSGRLKTDGVDVLYEYLDDPDSSPDTPGHLAVVTNRQKVFREAVAEYLQTVSYSDQDVIERFSPPTFGHPDVIVDPWINGGKPTFNSIGVRVSDVEGRVLAGEPFDEVIDDFDLDPEIARKVLLSPHGR